MPLLWTFKIRGCYGTPSTPAKYGAARMYRKLTDKLLCEACSVSPFHGLKLQIEPNPTRCHYPLMTYLTKIEASTALSIQWSLASMQPQRRPHINLHIKTQWEILPRIMWFWFCKLFVLIKNGELAKKSLFCFFHVIKQPGLMYRTHVIITRS